MGTPCQHLASARGLARLSSACLQVHPLCTPSWFHAPSPLLVLSAWSPHVPCKGGWPCSGAGYKSVLYEACEDVRSSLLRPPLQGTWRRSRA